jgi:methylenetetrahydrofolate dehydrogenase (NADP+) / methenyltetrahydrofolate cyclohydrolase
MTSSTALILSGKEAAARWREEITARVGSLVARGVRPGLATILVGDDPASGVYVRTKQKVAAEAGFRSSGIRLEASVSQAEVEEAVARLNADPEVHGFLVQLPLPEHVDAVPVLQGVDPSKDADGLHVTNLGRLLLGVPGPRPATPTGILRLLDHHGVELEGRRVTVIGRSQLVGRPLSVMMSEPGRDATVTVVHSRTADLVEATRSADVLVVAAGVPGFIGAEHVRPGAVVVDVGTSRVGDRLVGDVRFDEVVEIAAALSPVPGGVGPMTIAALLANTVWLAEAAMSDER